MWKRWQGSEKSKKSKCYVSKNVAGLIKNKTSDPRDCDPREKQEKLKRCFKKRGRAQKRKKSVIPKTWNTTSAKSMESMCFCFVFFCFLSPAKCFEAWLVLFLLVSEPCQRFLTCMFTLLHQSRWDQCFCDFCCFCLWAPQRFLKHSSCVSCFYLSPARLFLLSMTLLCIGLRLSVDWFEHPVMRCKALWGFHLHGQTCTTYIYTYTSTVDRFEHELMLCKVCVSMHMYNINIHM